MKNAAYMVDYHESITTTPVPLDDTISDRGGLLLRSFTDYRSGSNVIIPVGIIVNRHRQRGVGLFVDIDLELLVGRSATTVLFAPCNVAPRRATQTSGQLSNSTATPPRPPPTINITDATRLNGGLVAASTDSIGQDSSLIHNSCVGNAIVG